MKRRFALTALAAGAVSLALPALAAASLPPVDVYKESDLRLLRRLGRFHLKAAGFSVRVVEVDDIAQARKRFGLPISSAVATPASWTATWSRAMCRPRRSTRFFETCGHWPCRSWHADWLPGMEYPGRSDPTTYCSSTERT